MAELKTPDELALRLLMTDDLYLIKTQKKENNPAVEAEMLHFEYEGENNRYILILVDEEKQKIISSEDLEVLTAILAAKKLELRDVAIVNCIKYPNADFAGLKEFFSCSRLILFGINPAKIGLKDIDSNIISMHDGTRILATYSFGEMRNDTAKKRLFWNEMKQL